MVAKGSGRVEGVDYEETFAPTVRFESVRAPVAMAGGVGWELDQMDVTTAFLYAELTLISRRGWLKWGKGTWLGGLESSCTALRNPHECGTTPSTNF